MNSKVFLDLKSTLCASIMVFLSGAFADQAIARPCESGLVGNGASAIESAKNYFIQHQFDFRNKERIAVVDFSLPSTTPRFYLINIKTGEVRSFLVSHGMGSGDQLWASRFSNQIGSRASSIGAYMTETKYIGNHGPSLRLIGLEKTNSTAKERNLLLHGSHYVPKSGIPGRSHGSFVTNPDSILEIINELGSGALVYAWACKVNKY